MTTFYVIDNSNINYRKQVINMISFENLQQTNDEDCNDLIIVQQVRLSEEDSMDYMELDVLLRADKDDVLSDILSDHTGSFSNDILGFTDWTQLKPCLQMCQQVYHNKPTLLDRIEDVLNREDLDSDIKDILQELLAEKLKI